MDATLTLFAMLAADVAAPLRCYAATLLPYMSIASVTPVCRCFDDCLIRRIRRYALLCRHDYARLLRATRAWLESA